MISRRRAWIVIAATVAVVIVATPATARFAGHWLIVEDTPQHARAIVVLGGHLPFRAIEGASLYRAGWASDVWLTRGRRSAEEITLEELKITGLSEADYSRQVLERLDVPPSAIHILPERNRDTADEVRNVARHLRESGGGRAILVTSKFHTAA